jgi:hypothetical protein
MYSLNYNMVVQVLRQFNYSGETHADIPAQVALKGGGHAILNVQNGVIISCLILNKNGQKLYHNAEAQNLLLRIGVLEWELAPLAPSQPTASAYLSPPAQPKNTYHNVHVRPLRRVLPRNEMRGWSSLQRSVYFLCDGIHSCEQIAKLLSRPPNVIEQVIHNLQALGVIEK